MKNSNNIINYIENNTYIDKKINIENDMLLFSNLSKFKDEFILYLLNRNLVLYYCKENINYIIKNKDINNEFFKLEDEIIDKIINNNINIFIHYKNKKKSINKFSNNIWLKEYIIEIEGVVKFKNTFNIKNYINILYQKSEKLNNYINEKIYNMKGTFDFIENIDNFKNKIIELILEICYANSYLNINENLNYIDNNFYNYLITFGKYLSVKRIFFYRMHSIISYINKKTGKKQNIAKSMNKIYSNENFLLIFPGINLNNNDINKKSIKEFISMGFSEIYGNIPKTITKNIKPIAFLNTTNRWILYKDEDFTPAPYISIDYDDFQLSIPNLNPGNIKLLNYNTNLLKYKNKLYICYKNVKLFLILKYLGEIGNNQDSDNYVVIRSIDYEKKKNLLQKTEVMACKHIPISDKTYNKIKDNLSSFKEVDVLMLCRNNIIKNNNTPNLPFILFYCISDNNNINTFINPNIKKYFNNYKKIKKIKKNMKIVKKAISYLNIHKNNKLSNKLKNLLKSQQYILSKISNEYKNYGQKSIYIFSELYDDSLKNYLSIHFINFKIIKNIIFQILASILSLQKYCNYVHFDLHGGNILIKHINHFNNYIKNNYSFDTQNINKEIELIDKFDQESWTYTINKNKYFIDNLGILIKIWDFGRSVSMDNDIEIYTNLIRNFKRFNKKLYLNKKYFNKYKNNLKKNLKDFKYNIFSFDIWRIIAYVVNIPQLKDNKKIITFLNKIKKIVKRDWVDYIYKNRMIKNYRIYYLLEKYFKDFYNREYYYKPIADYNLDLD